MMFVWWIIVHCGGIVQVLQIDEAEKTLDLVWLVNKFIITDMAILLHCMNIKYNITSGNK